MSHTVLPWFCLQVGNTVLIVFVSYFGSRVHRPKCIGIGAIIASMASFLIALPHFISGKYHYTDDTGGKYAWLESYSIILSTTGALWCYHNNTISKCVFSLADTTKHVSGLCQAVSNHQAASSNQTCQETQSPANNAVFPILLLGQLLLGIGGVPIQPFGISYIDDYANKNNSPFYLGKRNQLCVHWVLYWYNVISSWVIALLSVALTGILFALTVIGPALGYLLGSILLRFYVDFNTMSPGEGQIFSFSGDSSSPLLLALSTPHQEDTLIRANTSTFMLSLKQFRKASIKMGKAEQWTKGIRKPAHSVLIWWHI